MNLQEALAKARMEKQNINYFTESEKAFTFSYNTGVPMRGGDSPIVVPKDGTDCLNILYALQETDYLKGDIINEGFIN